HAVPPARVRPPPATLLPLMLRSARIPSAARPAGALAQGGRDSPRPRLGRHSPASGGAQRLGDLARCQQTPRGGAEEPDPNNKEVIVGTRGGTASMVVASSVRARRTRPRHGMRYTGNSRARG